MQQRSLHINCKECGISNLCLPSILAEAEVAHLDSIIQRNVKPIKKGVHVFNTGDPLKYVYAIRAGAFKSYVVSYSGEEQIVAFHLPGELIGLDAINNSTHHSSAVALMESHICKVPYEMLNDLSEQITSVKDQMMRLLSKEITEDQELLLILGQKPADEKMASLLVNLSVRYKVRNLPHDQFSLPMSRSEMANYLGLTIETVSRIFNGFKQKGLIDIKGKQINLKDMTAMQHLAGVYCKQLC